MNGLEAILSRIMDDAAEQICGIKEQSDSRCAELLAAAERKADQIVSDARQKASEEAAALLRRSRSISDLENRKSILAAKQALIGEVISQAVVRVANLPAAEKTVLYRRYLTEQAAGGEIVVFARADTALAEPVLAAVNKEQDWQLQADPEPGDFTAGLILRQGLVETNLTVDLLVRSLHQELVSLASRTLFSE